MQTGNTLLLPVLLISIGTGWLLTALGFAPAIDWVWTLGLAAVGILTFVIGGVDKVPESAVEVRHVGEAGGLAGELLEPVQGERVLAPGVGEEGGGLLVRVLAVGEADALGAGDEVERRGPARSRRAA